MKILLSTFVFLILTLSLIAQSDQKVEEKSWEAQFELQEKKISNLNESIADLESHLSYIQKQNSDQLNFYQVNQNTIFWMISLFLGAYWWCIYFIWLSI